MSSDDPGRGGVALAQPPTVYRALQPLQAPQPTTVMSDDSTADSFPESPIDRPDDAHRCGAHVPCVAI
jgi:hypothetical protein